MKYLITVLLLITAITARAPVTVVQGPPAIAFGISSTLNDGLTAYWVWVASGTRFDSAPTGTPQDLPITIPLPRQPVWLEMRRSSISPTQSI
jgi:hypothetical protein